MSLELKQELEGISDIQSVSPERAVQLAQRMFPHIGHPDPVLRDEYIYMMLANWILQGKLDSIGLKNIYLTALDEDHLLYQLGEKGTDSVLVRSFSVLLIPPIVMRHKKMPFLTLEELSLGLEIVIHYIHTEQDVRGFDTEKGWMHSLAHGADALEELAGCVEIDAELLKDALPAIQTALITTEPLVHGEDERIIQAVLTMMKKLPNSMISHWIRGFSEKIPKVKKAEDVVCMHNVKNFLQSLYFHLKERDEYELKRDILYVLETIKS